MPFAGITYTVRPGVEDAVASIFSPENFIRVDSPVMRDDDDEEIGYLTCTGLFIQGETMVRVIQHDGGTLADVGRHMSTQEGVHEAERRLVPYLAAPRDTETPAGFLDHFRRSTMTVVDQQQLDNRPAAGLLALRYQVRPGTAAGLAQAYRAAPRRLVLPATGPVIALLLLAKDDIVIRVVQYEGCSGSDAIAHLAAQGPEALTDAWLAPFLVDPAGPGTDPADHVARRRMRCLSHLSAAVTETVTEMEVLS